MSVNERLLIVHNPYSARSIAFAAQDPGRYDMKIIREIPPPTVLDRDHVGVVMAGLDAVRSFARTVRPDNSSGTQTTFILTINAEELRDALDLIEICDGLLFLDINLQRAREILLLARQSFMAIPGSLLSSVFTDQLRVALLRELNRRELLVLALLGRAFSNDEIASRMCVSTATVKNIARSALSKLRLRNRTEAAVFLSRRRARRCRSA